MDADFYVRTLYPLQDDVLRICTAQDTGFYLTGGTAASRGYLRHRFSDDLDLFVDDDSRFGLWAQRLIHGLSQSGSYEVSVLLREERFVRLNVQAAAAALKIELVNDVPARVGEIRLDPVLGRLDSPENLLANKLTALVDRQEPKDLADVWGFCAVMKLPLAAALTGAQGKAAGLFPADVARVLLGAQAHEWQLVRWISAPPVEQYLRDLRQLGEELLLIPS